ncbi:MAG: ECF-type sigma factor [Gemmataceae bacterium]
MCRLALAQMRVACDAAPDHGSYRIGLKVTQYRLGSFEKIATRGPEALAKGDPNHPAMPAFLARRSTTGEKMQARATLARLRELMKMPVWATNAGGVEAFLREATETWSRASPSRRGGEFALCGGEQRSRASPALSAGRTRILRRPSCSTTLARRCRRGGRTLSIPGRCILAGARRHAHPGGHSAGRPRRGQPAVTPGLRRNALLAAQKSPGRAWPDPRRHLAGPRGLLLRPLGDAGACSFKDRGHPRRRRHGQRILIDHARHKGPSRGGDWQCGHRGRGRPGARHTCCRWTRCSSGSRPLTSSRPGRVAALLAGLTSDCAADVLGIPPRTAERHWAFALRARLQTECGS